MESDEENASGSRSKTENFRGKSENENGKEQRIEMEGGRHVTR